MVETVDSNVIPNSSDICDNDGNADQNAKEYDDERVMLANLIANLKLDIDETKKIQKQLKKANATLTHELNECKPSIVNPKYLKKAQSEKPCLYKIPYDKDDVANIFAPNCEETLILEEESRSKLHKELIKKYEYTYQNSLYELFTPQTHKSLDELYFANETRKKMWRKSFVKDKSNIVKNIGFLPTQALLSKSRHVFNVFQHNIINFKTIIDLDWEKRMNNKWQQQITHEITMLVKNLLIPLAIKTKENANEFE
nr:hypothetical protein [Tanacetum cinerariifolium]